MPTTYRATLTEVGAALVADAIASGTTLVWAKMALGDGNGSVVTVDPSRTSLVNEQYRAPLNDLGRDSANPNTIVGTLVVPPETGGWTIREFGIYDNASTPRLVAYGETPEIEKPASAAGTGINLRLRFKLAVSADANITLSPDSNEVYATIEYVKDNAVKSLSVSGRTITYTMGDGDTHTIQTQDTTYRNFVKSGSTAAAGLVPSPGNIEGRLKYLREDGSWINPFIINNFGNDYVLNANDFISPGLYSCYSLATSPSGNIPETNNGDFYLWRMDNGSVAFATILLFSPRIFDTFYIGHFWESVWQGWKKIAPDKLATSSENGLLSAADKSKLDGIADQAEVNQNAFSKVKIGNSTIQADSKTDTLNVVAGTGITLTADTTNDTVTITGKNFGKSGSTAAAGLVPSPGNTEGRLKYLREDGLWKNPFIINSLGENYVLNVNDFISPGLYRCDSLATSPSGNMPEINNGDFYIWRMDNGDAAFATILLFSPRISDVFYIGHFWESVWQGWKKIAPEHLATTNQNGLLSASDKSKLDGIAAQAEVNQNAFSKVKIGNSTIQADSKTDTIELIAGSNITITPDETNNKITIAASDKTFSERTAFTLTPNTIDLTIALNNQFCYASDNLIQVAVKVTVSNVSAAGWYRVAYIEYFNQISPVNYTDGYFKIIPKSNVFRDARISVGSNVLSIYIYLNANDDFSVFIYKTFIGRTS